MRRNLKTPTQRVCSKVQRTSSTTQQKKHHNTTTKITCGERDKKQVWLKCLRLCLGSLRLRCMRLCLGALRLNRMAQTGSKESGQWVWACRSWCMLKFGGGYASLPQVEHRTRELIVHCSSDPRPHWPKYGYKVHRTNSATQRKKHHNTTRTRHTISRTQQQQHNSTTKKQTE